MAIVLAMLGLFPMANVAAEGGGFTWFGSAVRHWLIWLVLLGGIVLVVARQFGPLAQVALARVEESLLAPRRRIFAWTAALAACLLSAAFGWVLFHWQPVTLDELSQQWQARLLVAGRLSVIAEPHPEFFSTMQTLERDGRWFAQYPLGGAILPAIGLLLHLPWLVNPLLAGVATLLVYRFATAVTTETEARGTTILFVLSPFVLFMAGSTLNHLATLVAIWAALSALPRWLGAAPPRARHAAAAAIGGGIGVAATIRPYDALVAATVIGIFQLLQLRGRRALWPTLGTQLLAGLLPVALLGAANLATTGQPLTFAYDLLHGPAHRPGFHLTPLGHEHTARRALFLISGYLLKLDLTLLAWPIAAVAPVVATLALQSRATRWDLLLVGLVCATLLAYGAYWGEGYFLQAPRFLFIIAPVFLLWTARLPRAVGERARSATVRLAVSMLVPLWLAIAWLSPPSTSQPFGVWTLAARLQERPPLTERARSVVDGRRLHHALVFVDDGWHARLAARLRALGARPFGAQLIVGHYDACFLQQLLDSADAAPLPPAERARAVFAAIDAQPNARPVPGLSALEQLALVPGQALAPVCRAELARARSNGLDFARFLPFDGPVEGGRIGGDVLYARHFGERNELLRERFGDRAWYVVSTRATPDSLALVLAPYVAPAR